MEFVSAEDLMNLPDLQTGIGYHANGNAVILSDEDDDDNNDNENVVDDGNMFHLNSFNCLDDGININDEENCVNDNDNSTIDFKVDAFSNETPIQIDDNSASGEEKIENSSASINESVKEEVFELSRISVKVEQSDETLAIMDPGNTSDKNSNGGSVKKNSLTKAHLATHGTKKRYVCDECDYQTDVKYNLKTHKERHVKKHRKLYPCKMCDFKGPSHIALLYHEATHTRPETYACYLCDYRASHLNLKRHLLTHHKVPLMCNKCDYKTMDENALRDHLLSHLSLQDKKYMCPFCECVCDDTSNLSQHLLSHGRAGSQEKETLKKENL